MNKWLRSALVPVVITMVMGALFHVNMLYNIENNFYDRITYEERALDDRIAIIGIDDASLEAIGRWPWPRSIHAELINRLAEAGAKGIGVDLIFSEPSQDPNEDEAMQQAVANRPHVILPSAFVFPETQESGSTLAYSKLLRPVYQLTEEQTAHINVLPGRGGVVRQGLLGVLDEQGRMVPSFSVRLANMLLPPDQQVRYEHGQWKVGSRIIPTNDRNQLHFAYARPPGDISPLSYVDVLNMEQEALTEYFHGKLVLIAPFSVALGDQYLTPMSQSVKMNGIEIHANIISALQDHRFFVTLEGKYEWLGYVILFVLSAGMYTVAERARAKWAAVSFVLFLVGYTLVEIYANLYFSLLLPFTYPVLTIVTTYVWAVVSNYVREKQERNRVTTLFGRYVSPQVVDEILGSEAAQHLGGTRKNVSVMFVDIRGFTTLSERIEPEEVIDVLNEYLELGTKAVFRQEGTLDKFIGDGIMSIFGAPIDQPNHPELAVRAALDMSRGAIALQEKLMKKYGYSVSFGIGINTGDAVIGNIGSKNRLDYTAIGDTVNMAARLESNAKAGQILISQSTYERVHHLFEVLPLGEIKVKGKEKPVSVYRVIGENTTGKE